jgi:hypothetical protein
MRAKYWLESLKGKDHSGYLDVDEDNIKMVLMELMVGACGLGSSNSG